jgi:hypothetical protein
MTTLLKRSLWRAGQLPAGDHHDHHSRLGAGHVSLPSRNPGDAAHRLFLTRHPPRCYDGWWRVPAVNHRLFSTLRPPVSRELTRTSLGQPIDSSMVRAPLGFSQADRQRRLPCSRSGSQSTFATSQRSHDPSVHAPCRIGGINCPARLVTLRPPMQKSGTLAPALHGIELGSDICVFNDFRTARTKTAVR